MKALKHLVFGKPGVTGMGKWKAHFLILIGLLLAKVVVDGLESLGRLMAIRGDDVPGFIAAAGGASELLFWPTALLALHLLVAIIQINIAGAAKRVTIEG